MTTQQVMAPLQRPGWATNRLVDESLIEYGRPIGSVPTASGDDQAMTVEVIQQDYLDFTADPPTVERQPPEIRLSGIRMTEAQVRELLVFLNSGVELIASVAATVAT